MKLKTKELTTCALFAALIAIGAFIKVDIPLPMYTMHFTFQWFFVLMAGFLLGAKLATVSVIVYLSIGLVGVPVFAAGGGPAYIFRPGFGFLLGFVLAAFVIGTITEKVGKNHKGMFLMASVAGLVTYYTIGAIYFYCINNFISIFILICYQVRMLILFYSYLFYLRMLGILCVFLCRSFVY